MRLGSSPRVWGQVYVNRNTLNHRGIIPTRVGTSFSASAIYCQRWDHPHACGDKVLSGRKVVKLPGSSPRVWGQALRSYRRGILFRIIPTRVGTSTDDKTSTRTDNGSSPRVWGQEVKNKLKTTTDGIIPTRVGTSLLSSCH